MIFVKNSEVLSLDKFHFNFTAGNYQGFENLQVMIFHGFKV